VASLFVEIRERLSLNILSSISDIVVAHSFEKVIETSEIPVIDIAKDNNDNTRHPPSSTGTSVQARPIETT